MKANTWRDAWPHPHRRSCNKLKELCAASNSLEDDLYWLRKVDSTDWLAHLRRWAQGDLCVFDAVPVLCTFICIHMPPLHGHCCRILLGAGYVAHSMRYRGRCNGASVQSNLCGAPCWHVFLSFNVCCLICCYPHAYALHFIAALTVICHMYGMHAMAMLLRVVTITRTLFWSPQAKLS